MSQLYCVFHHDIVHLVSLYLATCLQGQAVITETLLRQQQEAQDHQDGNPGVVGGGRESERDGRRDEMERRQYRTSSDSEPFEVIEEEVERNGELLCKSF